MEPSHLGLYQTRPCVRKDQDISGEYLLCQQPTWLTTVMTTKLNFVPHSSLLAFAYSRMPFFFPNKLHLYHSPCVLCP